MTRLDLRTLTLNHAFSITFKSLDHDHASIKSSQRQSRLIKHIDPAMFGQCQRRWPNIETMFAKLCICKAGSRVLESVEYIDSPLQSL